MRRAKSAQGLTRHGDGELVFWCATYAHSYIITYIRTFHSWLLFPFTCFHLKKYQKLHKKYECTDFWGRPHFDVLKKNEDVLKNGGPWAWADFLPPPTRFLAQLDFNTPTKEMHRRTTKRGTYSNWNSEEGKAKIKQSVQKWFAEFNGTMFLRRSCKERLHHIYSMVGGLLLFWWKREDTNYIDIDSINLLYTLNQLAWKEVTNNQPTSNVVDSFQSEL